MPVTQGRFSWQAAFFSGVEKFRQKLSFLLVPMMESMQYVSTRCMVLAIKPIQQQLP